MSITMLPRYASARFSELCDEADAAHDRLLTIQRRIKSIEDQRRLLGEHDKAAFEALSAEIARIDQTREKQRREFEQQSRFVTSLRTWINGLPANIEFETVEGPTDVELQSGEATDSAVDRIRAELATAQKLRKNVARAAPPMRDAQRAASARVDEIAKRGRPAISLDRAKLTIKFPVESSFGSGLAEDALATMAWLHADALRERLHADIEAMYAEFAKSSMMVLAPAERDKRLVQLDAEILSLERQEEQCISDASGYNMIIPRRENASPLAVLSLSVVKKERAVA